MPAVKVFRAIGVQHYAMQIAENTVKPPLQDDISRKSALVFSANKSEL